MLFYLALLHTLFGSPWRTGRSLPLPIACVIRARDYKAVVERNCKIVFAYQSNNDPIRIPPAALASGHHQLDAFIASTFQEAVLRQVLFSGLVFSHPERIKWNSSKRRFLISSVAVKSGYNGWEAEDDASADLNRTQVDTPGLPYQPNPLLVIMYGQLYELPERDMYVLYEAGLSFTR